MRLACRITLVGTLLLGWHPGGLSVPVCFAQDRRTDEMKERPRIGLVLSGGGARGAAHVGVLKVLEELRVPVDFIAGASMGSIVGGLYASGLSPQAMEASFGRVDWEAALKDAPDRQHISFRRKEDDKQALFPFELGVGKKGISLKSGLFAGQKLSFILRSMTLHAAGIADFDALRIPYRAVAADLDTGEAAILSQGDLAQAMRASMAVPGVFTPVVIDGRILVDGGIARNLPVDVVRGMGAERIIAVDVGTPPKGAEEGMSALAVAGQTVAILTQANVKQQRALLGESDLLIVPDLAGVKSSDFGLVESAILRGEEAARAVETLLRSFSVSEEDYAAYLRRQRSETDEGLPEVMVDAVEVHGVERVDIRAVTRRLKTQPGRALNLADLADDLTRIYQMGEFEQVGFRLVEEGDRNRVVIDARDKSWGPGYLRFGIGVESTFDGDSDLLALANYRRANINRLGAEWKTILTAGNPASIFTEFFQPLDYTGFWFVAPQVSFVRDSDETFIPGGEREEIRSETILAGLDVGVQFRHYAEIRVGALTGAYDAEARTTSAFEPFDADLGGWRASVTLDQLDNTFFPRHGNFTEARLFLSRGRLGADFEYDKLSFRSIQAASFGRNTLIGGLDFGTNLGTDIPFYDEFRLGGFFNLSGFERGELQGDVMGLLTLGYYRQVGRPGGLARGIYLGGALQGGNTWADIDQAELGDLLLSGTLFVGADTLLTPVYLGYGRTEGGEDSFYFFVGRLF